MVNCLGEVNTPLRLRGSHDKVGVDALDGVEVDHAVRVSLERTEAHALAHEIGAHGLAGRARPE